MLLPELKQALLNNQIMNQLLIFKYDDTDFICNEYIEKIANINSAEIIYINYLGDIPQSNPFLEEKLLYVYKCEILNELPPQINNLIIVTGKIVKEILEKVKDYVILFPKIEDWMLEDYVAIKCPGLDKDMISWLVYSFKDPYRLMSEVDKIRIFPPDTQKYIFNFLNSSNSFESPMENTSFNISTALQNKDTKTLSSILSNDNIKDINYIAILSIIQNNIKKLCKVWLNKQPTQDNTGLKSNQIWAINKLPRTYTKEQLIKALELTSNLNQKIKSGEFPINLTLDYIVIKLLGGFV